MQLMVGSTPVCHRALSRVAEVVYCGGMTRLMGKVGLMAMAAVFNGWMFRRSMARSEGQAEPAVSVAVYSRISMEGCLTKAGKEAGAMAMAVATAAIYSRWSMSTPASE
jgi:hypothetical protein